MSSDRLLIDILDERDRLRSLVADDKVQDEVVVDDEEEFMLNLQDEYSQDLEFLEEPQRCLLCGFNYLPKVNFINYYCRIHIGRIYADGTWSCCNQRGGVSGCRPSMHLHTPELAASVQKNAANSIAEISTDLIDYNLIDYNPRMIINHDGRGGDVSLTFVKDDYDQLKRLEGKFYRMKRVAVHERIL